MRTRVVALAVLLILLFASSIHAEQLSSTGAIDDPLLDWEGEDTPTLIYEGELSDPQDVDSINLGDTSGVVHSIHLVHADQPLKIEVREEGLLHGEDLANHTAFLISGRGNQIWVNISSVNFTSPNSYQPILLEVKPKCCFKSSAGAE